MAEVLVLGISHKTAPLELRERLALPEGRSVSVLAELAGHDEVSEAASISTCNRTELYMYAGDPVAAESHALTVLAGVAGIRPTELVSHLYSLRGSDAATHLMRVTAGLESMIIGEAEIQGQVKRAFELALIHDSTGPVLNRLFRSALEAGKRVRTETAISAGALSVSQVAVELAQRTLGELTSRSVLVIGAGETAELTAKALASRGVDAIFIANRHYDRAIGLADRFGGRAVRFEELPGLLIDADIVVSSTSSPHPVIERQELSEVMAAREDRPLLLIDLAVPRDISPTCRELTGVTVHDMDDLQSLVERNSADRHAEARRAETILDMEAERFEEWLAGQSVTPTVAALRALADEIVERALAENENRWESLSDADRRRLRSMAIAIASRILHEPTLRLKRNADQDAAGSLVHAVRELFGLDPATAELDSDAGAEVTELDERRRARREQ